MRILITGGAGFIGSHLCDFLLQKGHYVICMDNLITGLMNNIKDFLKEKNFLFINQDVTEYIKVEGEIDYVLHFASPASPVDYLRFPIQTLKVGSLGTHKTLGVAKTKNSKYLLASTSEVYGDPLENPQKESYYGNVNQLGKRGVYDETKRFAEAMVMAYNRVHKIDVKIVRIFNTYGPRTRLDDGRVIPNFISQALRNEPITIYGDGKQTRSFCYIADLVDGIYRLMESNFTGAMNLGNPEERSILSLAELIIRITRSRSKLTFLSLPENDPKLRCPDITLANEILNWRPKVSIEEGLKETIKWFKNKI